MPEEREEELRFVGAGGATLSGVLHHPDGSPRGSVLLAHCFTCSKDLHTMTRLARGLSAAGWAAMRFDFTGLGESGGSFRETSVSTNIGDLSRAAVTLIERGYGPCGLIGHSLGGAAAILAAQRLKTVESVVVIGAPSSADHVEHLFAGAEEELRAAGSGVVTIGGRSFQLDREFLDDLENHAVLDAVRSLDRKLLVIVPGADEVVDPSHGYALFAAASEPKSLVTIEGAGHLLAKREHAEAALKAIIDFLSTT